ncbi:T9SS type A sorting domain-containing protein [Flavobacterium dauae]|uniref:T9SS type A sorting domain-containing protein n=1 Tax=Flavobacterium dauae TaxID=1563479 RepID=UPI00101B3919|nr:T9SS type A sorting domain-containing protein [Flavobacterium dauae]WLD22558.1 T9SS type A sorting domain-containing protein [Flavobacterium dauae]
MMKKIYLLLVVLLAVLPAKAQVLWSDDFDSYPAGDLITTPQQGGWLSGSTPSTTASIIVTPETGKGNVIVITSNGVSPLGAISFRQASGSLSSLWDNRTTGNNILKFEYEFYGVDVFNSMSSIFDEGSSHSMINVAIQSNYKQIFGSYLDITSPIILMLKDYNTQPFPYNTWIKVEAFIDYNTNKVYFYLPTLNLQAKSKGSFTQTGKLNYVYFFVNQLNAASVAKFDNIKISALQTLPSYILSNNEFITSTFNVFPNPATNMVTITNNENIVVEQVTIYDISGKVINTQTFNKENEVQLNVEHLASGTYMLHIQTNEGTAVKKLVKK